MDINNDGDLPPHSSIYLNDFLLCEANPDLQVTPLIPLTQPIPVIDEEVEDEHVSYMENLIAQKNEFYSLDWPARKRLFNKRLEEQVNHLSIQVANLTSLTSLFKKILSRRHGFRSARNSKFTTTCSSGKKHDQVLPPLPHEEENHHILDVAAYNHLNNDPDHHMTFPTDHLTPASPTKTSFSFDEPFEEVIYPKGDPYVVSICKSDVDLLQPETFVNDTIIDFYINYLKNQIQGEERPRLHFFNSFLFRKLADLDKDPSSIADGKATFLRVRKWTRKVDMFGKDYIFVPVPQQENSYDCGLFLLHYLELFLAEAPQNFSPFKIHNASNFLYLNWFPPAEASSKRTLIEKLIFELLENHSREVNNEQNQSCESPVLLNNNTEIEVLSGRCTPLVDCKGSMTQTQDQGIDAYRSVNPDPKCQSPAGQTLNPDHDHLTCTPDHITFPTDHHLAPVSSTKTSYGGQSSSSSHQNISDHMQRDPPSPKNPDHTCQSIDTPAGPAANQSPKGLGFNARATVLNAFTAKATTSPGHNTGFNPKATTSNTPYIPDELVCLSDSCEARKKPKHIPTEPERILATHLLKCQTVPAKTVIGYVDNNLWELFYKTIKASKNVLHIYPQTTTTFTNNFLLELSTPQKQLDSTHSVVEFPNGDEVNTTLVYERLDKHCLKCLRLDHEIKECLVARAEAKRATKEASQIQSYEVRSSVSKAREYRKENTPRESYNKEHQAAYHQREDRRYGQNPHSYREGKESWRDIGRNLESSSRYHPYQTRENYSNTSRQQVYREVRRLEPEVRQSVRGPEEHGPLYNATYTSCERVGLRGEESSSSKALASPTARGSPLQREHNQIDKGALEEALGEVRETMAQYTKCAGPTKSAARQERLRQAEEKCQLEETAARMVRASLNKQISPPVRENYEAPSSPAGRIPAALRLGIPIEDLREGQETLKMQKRKPGRPSGKRKFSNSPKVLIGASSRKRKVQSQASMQTYIGFRDGKANRGPKAN
ncbi:hypothetical protein Bca52824_046485 [Brassica carinata]|uniref:Ubiquitin-like protease family profile domain-containing protein n=1 Tax=Brassica carinata TaxID=52824 RepID=A0A8X7USH3_BRACI|nr:hypothetical protein Bca52824_046485 [Brassica carinata]